MGGVLVGFAIIGSIIVVGYLVGRLGILGDGARFTLSRLVFFVLSPCLLFVVLADADVSTLFSQSLVVSAIAAVATFVLYAVVAVGVWRRPVPEAVVGIASSGWVNANNIGIPVAVYVIGDPAFAAPVIMLQLIVFTPVALTILDLSTSGQTSVGRVLSQPLRSPIIVGSILGVVVSVSGIEVPDAAMEPFRVVGAAAVPIVLLSFGMSLHGQKPLAPDTFRRDVLLASAVKLAVMPTIAWVLAYGVFALQPLQVFATVVLASLPTAQNVFNYAQRYERGEVIARDTVLITTIGAVPLLLVVAALLGP